MATAESAVPAGISAAEQEIQRLLTELSTTDRKVIETRVETRRKSISRMLQDPQCLKPAEWRKTPPNRSPPGRPRTASEPETLLATLRSRIRELPTASEEQARCSYEKGYRAGQSAGRKAAEQDVQAAVSKLSTAVADFAEMRTETIRRAEADAVRLAIEISRRILHRELTSNASALESLICAALEKLRSQEVYRVRVHPELETVMRECLREAGRDAVVEVIKDPIQPKGGVVFEISRGTLDASLDAQLREIERGLNERLEEQR